MCSTQRHVPPQDSTNSSSFSALAALCPVFQSLPQGDVLLLALQNLPANTFMCLVPPCCLPELSDSTHTHRAMHNPDPRCLLDPIPGLQRAWVVVGALPALKHQQAAACAALTAVPQRGCSATITHGPPHPSEVQQPSPRG